MSTDQRLYTSEIMWCSFSNKWYGCKWTWETIQLYT